MMWIVLAVIAFVIGQGYLFHCLKKLDGFLLKHSADESQEPDGNQQK